ncbi:MAG: hypothetical protein EB094_03740 [Synechococcaceae bacterium WBA_3_309]|nr:hypothetical protein [Synechococcaceae bacterium WBA_3_309]
MDALLVKNNINHYVYKNSICIDAKHGVIRRFVVTPANIHDNQMIRICIWLFCHINGWQIHKKNRFKKNKD